MLFLQCDNMYSGTSLGKSETLILCVEYVYDMSGQCWTALPKAMAR